MSETAVPATTGAGPAAELRADSIGLFGTTSSTLANIAPALSVFLTIPAIVIAMGSMAPWAFVLAAMAVGVPVLLRGTGVSVKAAFALFLTEALALLVLSVIVLVRAHGALGVPFHAIGGSPGGFAGIGGLTFGLAVFGYVGWENSAPLAEESRHPRRTIPRTVVLSILVVMLVFFISAYALVVGFAGWQGNAAGIKGIAGAASPYLTLASHYAPWLHLVMFLIGITSSLGCFLAAAMPGSRYIFHGARAGLLPRPLARVSGRTGVPLPSILVYIGLMAVATVLLDLIMHNAITISTDEAGISTVPVLIIYGATCVLLPLFVRRVDRAHFSLLRHGLFPLIGVAVMGYGIWESINPGQAAPADHYWIWVLAYLVVAAAGALIVRRGAGPNTAALSQGLDD